MKVINAENTILGRLASYVASQALKSSDEFYIVNSEKAIITGSRKFILNEYLRRRKIGGSKRKGPYYPRRPDRLMKRTIRGMLPYQKRTSGRNALKRIKVYIGIPPALQTTKIEEPPAAVKANKPVKYISVGELCTLLGSHWNYGEW